MKGTTEMEKGEIKTIELLGKIWPKKFGNSKEAPSNQVHEIKNKITIGEDNSIKGVIKTPVGEFKIIDGTLVEGGLKAILQKGSRKIKLNLTDFLNSWEGMFTFQKHEMSLFVIRIS